MEVLYKHILEQYKTKTRCLLSPVIFLRLEGDNRLTYTFEKMWGLYEGNLHGDNFFTDICKYDCISADRNVNIECVDGVYIIRDTEGDPDWLLYLWKFGRGEKIDGFITSAEVPALYDIYTKYEFEKMANMVSMHNKSWCVLI